MLFSLLKHYLELYITDNALKVSHSLHCFTTSISHVVEIISPGCGVWASLMLFLNMISITRGSLYLAILLLTQIYLGSTNLLFIHMFKLRQVFLGVHPLIIPAQPTIFVAVACDVISTLFLSKC